MQPSGDDDGRSWSLVKNVVVSGSVEQGDGGVTRLRKYMAGHSVTSLIHVFHSNAHLESLRQRDDVDVVAFPAHGLHFLEEIVGIFMKNSNVLSIDR